MYRFIVLALFLSVVPSFSHATTAPVSSTTENWLVAMDKVGSLVFTVHFRIESDDALTVIGTCKRDELVSSVKMTLPAAFTKTDVFVFQSIRNKVHTNGLDCEVTVNSGALTYVLIQNGLVVRMLPIGSLRELKRID